MPTHKIEVPKIVRPMCLNEYAPELGETVIHVWVNPPRRLLEELADCQPGAAAGDEAMARRGLEIMAELWSQGPEGTQWTVDELLALGNATVETDPSLWPWLSAKTMRMVTEHRAHAKKA